MNKKLFDAEYQTQWREEVEYLKSVGIEYTFVKRINGISTYKYKKTGELFQRLAIFYFCKCGEMNRRDYIETRSEIHP